MAFNVPSPSKTLDELKMALGTVHTLWDRKEPIALRVKFEELIVSAEQAKCIEQNDVLPNLWAAIEMRCSPATSILVRKLYDRFKLCDVLYHAIRAYERALGDELPDFYEDVRQINARGRLDSTPVAGREAAAVVDVIWAYMQERAVRPDDCMLGRRRSSV